MTDFARSTSQGPGPIPSAANSTAGALVRTSKKPQSTPMTNAVPSTSRTAEPIPPTTSIARAPVRTSKKSKNSNAPPVETVHANVSSRRKNIYLPNAKSAKTLWLKRDSLTDLLNAALEMIKTDKTKSAETAEEDAAAAAAVVAKEYEVTKYEDLPQEEQNMWQMLAKEALQVEASFKLVQPG
jgi:hypothetical protein